MQEDKELKEEQLSQTEAPKAEPEVSEEPEQKPVQDPRDVLILKLAEERDALKDEMIRALAEAQNIQRRLREQYAESLKYASQPLVEELLPVLDNFDRTIAAFEKGASADKLVKGVKQVEKQLKKALSKVNVKKIEAIGAKFDPEIHEALTTIESDVHEEDTVTAEIDSGYTMHERVIRPARVQVTKKP